MQKRNIRATPHTAVILGGALSLILGGCQAVSGGDPIASEQAGLQGHPGYAPGVGMDEALYTPVEVDMQPVSAQPTPNPISIGDSGGAMPYSCPLGSTYTATPERGFCVYDDVDLPPAPATAFCDNLEGGIIGFSWRLEEMESTHYMCPQGFFYESNVLGDAFCLAWAAPLPKLVEVRPYCDGLEQGYIGFSWPLDAPDDTARQPDHFTAPPSEGADDQASLCPTGSRLSTDGYEHGLCLFEGLDVPVSGDFEPFCHWLHQGWLGYSWRTGDVPGYVCPQGWDKTVSDDGVNQFCMRQLDVMPKSNDVQPYCHFLYQGFLGFEWEL
ncbi:MAG: hypothetical protein ACI9WU_004303 [Myxococcota bacterium]|jgi:hypothetical protein